MSRRDDPRRGLFQDDKPRLLYQTVIDRKTYTRRLRWTIIGMLASGGVWYMLGLPQIQDAVGAFGLLPPWAEIALLNGGRLVALAVLIFSGAHTATNLVLALRRRTERVRFFDRGFTWQRHGQADAKYAYNAIKTYVEAPRDWRFRKKPVLQWGRLTLNMRDGSTFHVTPAHGDMRLIAARIRPYIAEEIGTRMGQMLRAGKSFRVHKAIAVTPDGLVIDGKTRIAWKQLTAKVDKTTLMLAVLKDGTPHPVKQVPTREVQNLAAFMELVETTTENFQRPNPYA